MTTRIPNLTKPFCEPVAWDRFDCVECGSPIDRDYVCEECGLHNYDEAVEQRAVELFDAASGDISNVPETERDFVAAHHPDRDPAIACKRCTPPKPRTYRAIDRYGRHRSGSIVGSVGKFVKASYDARWNMLEVVDEAGIEVGGITNDMDTGRRVYWWAE